MRKNIKKIIAYLLTAALCLTSSHAGADASDTRYEKQDTVISQEYLAAETSNQTSELNADASSTAELTEVTVANGTTESTEAAGSNEATETTGVAGANGTTESTEAVGANGATESTGAAENSVAETISYEILDEVDEIMEKYEADLVLGDSVTIQTADDFIALSNMDASLYQDKEIIIAPHTTDGSIDLSETAFKGFGSDEAPFAGKIGFDGEYTGYITLDKAMFNCLSQDAEFTTGMNLSANNNMTDPLLAKKYVKGEGSDVPSVSLKLYAKNEGSIEADSLVYSSFGGIIGEMGEGSSLSLSVVNRITDAGYTKVSGTGNRGYFCNTMGKDTTLTIVSFSGLNDFSVTSSNAVAGGIVGYMVDGASLILAGTITYSGKVTGKNNAGGIVGEAEDNTTLSIEDDFTEDGASVVSSNGNSGGVIGSATNTQVDISDGKKVTIKSTVSANGTSGASGGVIGRFIYNKNSNLDINMEKYDIHVVKSSNYTSGLSTGKYSGGVFGFLANDTDGYEILVHNSTNSTLASDGGTTSNIYGGVIGRYEAKKLKSELNLENLGVASKLLAGNTSFSGTIGEIGENTYVVMNNVSVTVNRDSKSPTYYGGVVAYAKEGAFVNIGNFTSNGDYTATAASGGLVGNIDSGVVRIHGTTDLSKSKTAATTRITGQLVGNRNGALVYALGDGVTADTQTVVNDTIFVNEHWELLRCTTVYVSDIGDWGEIIRLDGTKLREAKVSSGVTSDTALMSFDETNHVVSIAGFPSAEGQISSTSEFVANALSYQLDSSSSLVKGRNVTIDMSLTINSDIDLSGTGLTGFTRDSSISTLTDAEDNKCRFNGKISGGDNTITLSIGEAFGKRSNSVLTDTSVAGNGQIYDHSYIGLFGQRASDSSQEISNLDITGVFNIGIIDAASAETVNPPVYVGTIVAYQVSESTVKISNVDINSAITYVTNNKKYPSITYVGGAVGFMNTGANVVLDSCEINALIDNKTDIQSYYNAGLIAFLETSASGSSGSIKIKDCKLGGSILANSVTAADYNAYTSGVLATTGIIYDSANSTPSRTKIEIDNLLIDGLTIQNTSKGRTGGFFGYEWRNTDVDITGVVIKNSTLNAPNALFGGLVYCASGVWNVKDNSTGLAKGYTNYGIEIAEVNTYKGRTVAANPSALLISRGDNYLLDSDRTATDELALYMNLESENSYKISSQPTITFGSGSNTTYFDEIVGRTIFNREYTVNSVKYMSGPNHNGIVSIATAGNSLINQTACNTYKKQLTTDYINPCTRYYYNLEKIRLQSPANETPGENTESTGAAWADSVVESGEEMLLWSLAQYAEKNLYELFDTNRGGEVVISGDINLTGLSYYPVDYTGNVTITDATITYDYETIDKEEEAAANKALDNKDKQHYMMQDGLFYRFTGEEGKASSITINGDDGLTFRGTIGKLDITDFSGGSGALVCGQANGATDGTKTYDFSISSTKIVFDGIKVYDKDGIGDYAPLFINKIGSHSSVTIEGVTTDNYTEYGNSATSLIGDVGSVDAISIMLYFENIEFNGLKSASIFKNATLLESFTYSDAASSGAYNFNKDSENITYGKEISNNVGGNGATGRNPYDTTAGTGQVWYYDTFGGNDYVTLGTTEANVGNGFFTDDYLRYVHIPEGGANGSISTSHELDINQLVVDILEGCGTYDDPYIISSNGQLETLAKCLSNKGQIVNWKIKFNYLIVNATGAQGNGNSTIKLSTHNTVDANKNPTLEHELFTSGNSTWTSTEGHSITSSQALAYLRNAYYMVKPENDAYTITVNSSFYGLGGYDPDSNVFSGVIVGAAKQIDGVTTYPTIKVASHNSDTATYFGGLIAYSGGSVVKNLNIDYTNTRITLLSTAPSQVRANQSFFGGVIGYVVGGDNIIDNVKVVSSGLTISVIGDYQEITDIGGYVGLVGGNTSEGGGVIFRNTSGDTGLTGEDYAEDSEYYYRNAFVGRVLDGYAFTEGCSIDNTDKNYKIPSIDMSDVPSMDQKNKIVKITSAQQLWILSAIVNSGAGGMNGSTYTNAAYGLGRVRRGTYDNVGGVASADDEYDDAYWGGISYDGTADAIIKAKYSYLVYKCLHTGITATTIPRYMAYITGNQQKSFSLIIASDCDMSSYGNGFRGVGTSYQDNAKVQDNGLGVITFRTMSLGNNVGAETGVSTITLDRKVKEYTVEEKTGWWIQGIGLFPAVNFSTAVNTTVKNIIITGNSLVEYSGDSSYIGEASAGGFAGVTANIGNSSKIITFSNVRVENLVVTGSKYSGGFFGVAGKSSRTKAGSTTITPVGCFSGYYIFKNCGYNNITIEGGYSAGGFIGTYKNDSRYVKIQGVTELKDSKIGWVNDACYEMYHVGCTGDAKTNGYSGGAGFIGYYSGGNMDVSISNGESTTINGLYIYGPQFAYNCDYGLGGIAGLQANGTLTMKNTTIKNTAIEVIVDDSYIGPHKTMEKYYTTPACGLIKGYTKTALTSTGLTVENCYVINAGYCGGLVGQQSGNATLTDTDIDGLVVYTQGSGSYSGSAKVGGIFGGVANTTIKQLSMKNVEVISDGTTGLIIGMERDSEYDTFISNFSVDSCTVATTQNQTASYFLGGQTDPSMDPTKDPGTDKAAGGAGIVVGVDKHNSSGAGIQAAHVIKGYNIGINNSIVGYYCGDKSKLKYKYNHLTKSGKYIDKTSGSEIIMDNTTIGAYLGENSGKPYSEIAITEETPYKEGYFGIITGGMNDNGAGYIQIVGLSVSNSDMPYEINGYNDATFIKKEYSTKSPYISWVGNQKNNNYVIWADYMGSFSGDANMDGTTGAISSNYPVTKAALSPYVVVNPNSELRVYSSASDKTGMLLTGNGMSDEAKNAIVSDINGTTAIKDYVYRYNRAKYIPLGTSNLVDYAAKFDKTTGEYKDKISTYSVASESDMSNYNGLQDFEVLLIDTTNSNDITTMVREYISVLTNYDQTGRDVQRSDFVDRTKARYTSLTAYTYKWDATSKKFIKTTSSLIVKKSTVKNSSGAVESGFTVSVATGAHDNQNDQFTVLDAFFPDPNNTNQGYHLFIPVVVKKVLETEFSIKMLNGSSAYENAYAQDAAILASYGENFTAQLTYSYNWTESEWNDNIAAGTNFLWSYDKQVKLGDGIGNLGNSTTRYTLVDMNRRGAGNTFFTGTGQSASVEDSNHAAVLKFDNLSGYESVFMSDLLDLTVTKDSENGTLKYLSTAEAGESPPAGATIRKWNGTSFDYYGLQGADDPEGTEYYTIKVTADSNGVVDVKEVYYLTVNCKEGVGVITQDAALGLTKMTSSNSNALPSKMGTKSGSKQYTLGDFYALSDVEIIPDGKNHTGLIEVKENDYVDVTVKSTVSVPSAYISSFNSYAKNDDAYFRFAIQMHNDGDSGSDMIDPGTLFTRSVTINDVEVDADDYELSIVNGVCYLIIKKKGVDFQNAEIVAKICFNYEGATSKMAAQFPQRASITDTSGISFSVNSAIAYSENGLDGSRMSGQASNNNKFYREEINVASLSYNSYNTASVDGNTSQLGINGREVSSTEGDSITSLGMYDASQVTGLVLNDSTSAKYPKNLICTLELEKKTDQGDGTVKYEPVDIGKYLSDIEITAGESVTGAISGEKYCFTVALTPEQIQDLISEQIDINIRYFVKSDTAIEGSEFGNVGQYANYRVTLTAHLANSSGTALVDDVSDYIIYTNAKFYLGIISTIDYDE